MIRVLAPSLTKSCAAVKLTDNTTAGDVVDKFRNTNFTNGRYVLSTCSEMYREFESLQVSCHFLSYV